MSYLDIFTVLFVFLLHFILVAKIISVRSNWKTLFFKSNNILSWKTILRKEPFSVFAITLLNSMVLSITTFNFLNEFSNFEYNNQLLIIIAIITLFNTIILFEFSFLGLLFMFKGKMTKCDNANKPIDDSIKFQFTNSKVILFLILILSIIFARFVSEQVNDVLLGFTSLDLELFLASFVTTLILFIYFIYSLNVIIFKFLNLDYKIDNKGNTGIILISVFLFINGVYLAKYIATALVYLPFLIPDPVINEIFQQLNPFYDPILIDIVTYFNFLITSIVFAIIIYLIFLHNISKKYSLELKWNFNQISSSQVDGIFGKNGQKIIKKLLSKQFKNPDFIKHFSNFYFMFWFYTPNIISLVIAYLLISDSMFDKHTYIIFVFKYQYIFGAYILVGLVVCGIFEEVRKIQKYAVTDFISKKLLYNDIKLMEVYYSLIISCSIFFSIKYVYQISENYGGLLAPEIIQVLHCGIFLFIFGYILLILFKKFEKIVFKAIEEEIK